MKLLQNVNKTILNPNYIPPSSIIIEEDAGVGAGDVSAVQMPLFNTLLKRPISKKPQIIRYSDDKKLKKSSLNLLKTLGLSEALIPDKPDANFNLDAVMAKLKGLEDKESVDTRDVVSFGLNDSSGAVVKVSVPRDQADSFEQELEHILQYQQNKHEDLDIAEILYKLKDSYTIVDVTWPTTEEDAEEDASKLDINPEQDGQMPEGGEDGEGGEDLGLPPGPEASPDQTGDVTSLLTQVIDMLKADAEAKKADAQAREAEAKTRQSIAARDQAKARVSQEEQMLQMDQFNKEQKAKDTEAKRLAQLAKWKHDVKNNKFTPSAQDPNYDFVPGDEEEELLLSPTKLKKQIANKGASLRGKVSPADIAKYIMNRVK